MSLFIYTTYVKGILGLGVERDCTSQRRHQTSDKNRMLCQMVVFIVHQLYKNIYSIVIDHLSLLRQGLSEPDFYGDLVYKLRKIVGSNNFSAQFIKIISHYKKMGYNINVLQQTACLVVNPITVGNFAFLFNCTPVGRTSDSMMVPT